MLLLLSEVIVPSSGSNPCKPQRPDRASFSFRGASSVNSETLGSHFNSGEAQKPSQAGHLKK